MDNNYKSTIRKQSFIIFSSVLVMVLVLIGTSYSLFASSDKSSEQVVTSGTLSISYEGSVITTTGGTDSGTGELVSIEPISESDATSGDPYKIVITNNGTLAMKYNLLIYTDTGNTLPHSYISVKEKNGETKILNTFDKLDNTKTELNEIRYKLSSEPYIIEPGATITHELYVWVDAANADDNVTDKVANIKIIVDGEATSPLPHVPTASETITGLADGADSSSTDVIDKGTDASGCTNTLAYDGTADNNLRYVGSNPCNYVTYNGELWRIIGVMNNIKTGGGTTENIVKIIRNDSLGNYSWDSSESGINDGAGINQWGESKYKNNTAYEGSDIMRELNTDYLGNITIGTDGKWYSSSKYTKNTTMPSTTISTSSQSMIEDLVWNLGSQGSNSSSTWTTPNMYTYERSTNTGKICSSGGFCNDDVTRTSTWTGKVALMYPSDYGYATAGGSTTNRATCLTTSMYDWDGSGVSNCKDNDWLFTGNSQWTLSPTASSSSAFLVFYVRSSGYVRSSSAGNTNAVRPVVFLKSSISITGGDGSSDNPYTLG